MSTYLDAELAALTAPAIPTYTDNVVIAAIADRLVSVITDAAERAVTQYDGYYLDSTAVYMIAKRAWVDSAVFDDSLIRGWLDGVPDADQVLAVAALEGAVTGGVSDALRGRNKDREYTRMGLTLMLENPREIMQRVYFGNLGLT